MVAMTKQLPSVSTFLQRCLTRHLSDYQVKKQADELELKMYLIQHGFPAEMIEHATADEIYVMVEVAHRQDKRELERGQIATAGGLGIAFGSK